MSQPRTTRFFFEDELSLTAAAGAVPLQPVEEEHELPLPLLVPGEEQVDDLQLIPLPLLVPLVPGEVLVEVNY